MLSRRVRAFVRQPIALFVSLALIVGVTTLTVTTSGAGAAGNEFNIDLGSTGTGQGDPATACFITTENGFPVGDESSTDANVCTNDDTQWHWEYNIPANTGLEAVLSQTLPAGITWDADDKSECVGGPSFGYTGTWTVTTNPDGSTTASCDATWTAAAGGRLGQMNMGAFVGPDVPNGTTLTPNLSVTTGGTTTQYTPPTVTVLASPRVDLQKNMTFLQQTGTDDQIEVFVTGSQMTGTKGLAPLIDTAKNPITFTDDLSKMPAGTHLDKSGAGTNCYVAIPNDPLPANSNENWDCEQNGTTVSVSVTGAETDGVGSTPVADPNAQGGNDIPVLSGAFILDVPLSSITASTSAPDQLAGFDPDAAGVDATGNPTTLSNYGTDYEPGGAPGATCGAAGPPYPNNNCAAIIVNPAGGGAPFFAKGLELPDSEKYSVNGPNLVEVGQKFTAQFALGATQGVSAGQTGGVACDKFDPTKQQVDPSTPPTVTGASNVTFEYTNHPYADDTERQNTACDDADGPWFSSIAAAGGPSAVTGVRALFGDPLPFGNGNTAGLNVPMIDVDSHNGEQVSDWGTLTWDGGGPVGVTAFFTTTVNKVSISKTAVASASDPTNVVGSAGAGNELTYRLHPTFSSVSGDSETMTITDQMSPCVLDPVLDPASTADWTMTILSPGNAGPDGIPCTGEQSETGPTVQFVTKKPVTDGNAPDLFYDVKVNPIAPDKSELDNTATLTLANNGQPAGELQVSNSVAVRAAQLVSMEKVRRQHPGSDQPAHRLHDGVGEHAVPERRQGAVDRRAAVQQ